MSNTPKLAWRDGGFELWVSSKGKYRNITIKSPGKRSGQWRIYNLLASPHRVKMSFKSESKQ